MRSKVDVVTYEFENIPVNILKEINKEKNVFPKPDINQIIQNRKLEKSFVNELGIKTTQWAYIKTAGDVKQNKNLLPGFLKTNTLGYDGHGQFIINSLCRFKRRMVFYIRLYIRKKLI